MSEAKHTPAAYYAEDGKVWKHPIHKANEDGSTSITLGFPVCAMHEAVGDKAAETVAQLMNQGEAASEMLEALKFLRECTSGYIGEAFSKIDMLIAKATGSNT